MNKMTELQGWFIVFVLSNIYLQRAKEKFEFGIGFMTMFLCLYGFIIKIINSLFGK